jgi:hypothetical protein
LGAPLSLKGEGPKEKVLSLEGEGWVRVTTERVTKIKL